eukprot:401805_1
MGNGNCAFCSEETNRNQISDIQPMTGRNTTTESTIQSTIPSSTIEPEQALAPFESSAGPIESLHHAIVDGNHKMMIKLVNQHSNQDIVNAIHKNQSALHVAVRHKQYKMIKYLFSQQALTNTPNERTKDSPLHYAVQEGDVKCVKLLSRHGGNALAKNVNEETPISIALDSRNVTVYRNIANVLLEDWLERKEPGAWIKMWVVIRDEFMLWNDKRIVVGKNGVDTHEKKKWDTCINILSIEAVETAQGSRKKKFTVKIQGKNHLLRAKNSQMREYWMRNLKAQIAFVNKHEQ